MSNKRIASFAPDDEYRTPRKRQCIADENGNTLISQSPPASSKLDVGLIATRAFSNISSLSFTVSKLQIGQNKNYESDAVQLSSLLGQPTEIFHLIASNLSLEDSHNLSLTCKTANRAINTFQSSLSYNQVDEMFAKLTSNEEKTSNMKRLLNVIISIGKKEKKTTGDKLFEWLIDAPKNCPRLSMPMMLETILHCLGECKATKLTKALIKHWMSSAATRYNLAYPIEVDSSTEAKKDEETLCKRFNWIVSNEQQPLTKAMFFSLMLHKLASISDAYKFMYLFCAPRSQEGFIDYTHYAVAHQGHENQLNFGALADGFMMLLNARKEKLGCSFSHREIFVILEDLTTTPLMWSMHSFVNFLMTRVEFCILSTFIRFMEGYHSDAASTFYYTIRANASDFFLAKAATGILHFMSKETAMQFVKEVVRKSYEVIQACNPVDVDRLTMLHKVHEKAIATFNGSLKHLFNVRCVSRLGTN